ncbi:ATP-grasp enzyme, D-alanine-D-alanine ligase (plasmid) [Thioflavicoccus mobilis 8321]|uniref:ATP-grasp enzyme, D-alanine-D-alanine ligase n=1 Tax=Thioflavicoccus mobilis 8321 TaxID=765912 RepID=L0H3W3_9GAMM|nr:ATP-grasp enzyme, D-alanine-D-alanine ligase [Thioflavicoccus mobilis]AGA92365.1 ATP-grasp enzyme, D-alanine-D-alanine ligase [Thioflavicoccus mobilis 8321]
MRVVLVENIVQAVLAGESRDIASDREMEVIPGLVADALTTRGHDVSILPANWDLPANIGKVEVDIVLNLAEGFAGSNGHEWLVPAILEQAGVPYTGADAGNILLTRDKLVTKTLLAAHNVTVPRHQIIRRHSDLSVREIGFPIIAKPLREEASIGIGKDSVVVTEAQWKRRVEILLEIYKQPVLCEEYVQGREFSIGVWGNNHVEALPMVEFVFPCVDPLQRFRSFEHKWLGDQEVMVAAEGVADVLREQASTIACLAHRVLNCRDYSRADFRLSADGRLFFLEHNYNPGIGPNTHGLSNTFTRQAELAGFSYEAFLEKLMEIARGRYQGLER